nr:9234_t:CDS:2 [Entrophospora candida]
MKIVIPEDTKLVLLDPVPKEPPSLKEPSIAEKPGPRRQILCELLIEEMDQALGKQEMIEEPPFMVTSIPIIKQQTVIVENNIITRTTIVIPPEKILQQKAKEHFNGWKWDITNCAILTPKTNPLISPENHGIAHHYAYLSVVMANNFQHIPQKVKNYIETKNCSEDEGDVLKAAEAHYIKLHG